MGKNKKDKTVESGKQADKAGKHPSDKKFKRDGKPKKAKPDHLTDIPFRLREIMKSKEKMKRGPLKAKKLKEGKPNFNSGDIPALHFRRGKKESVRAYVQRMEDETKHILFLTQNQVDRKPELDADTQEGSADKGKSEKKKEHDKVRLQRLQQKKLDRQETKLEKEMFVDHVPFGEVTMAPPTLSAKPKKAQVKPQKTSRELLLNSLLGHTVTSSNASKPSMARQRIMEEERERAVEAYRRLKKQKQQQHEARTAGLEKLKNLQ